MKYTISILPAATEALGRLAKYLQRVIDGHILALATNPHPATAIPSKDRSAACGDCAWETGASYTKFKTNSSS